MNTVLVTAGVGREHKSWAKRLVNHVNKLADGARGAVRAIDLSDKMPWGSFADSSGSLLSYSSLAHLHVWRVLPNTVERVLWIDTDTYVKRPILEDELPSGDFAAVRDPWVQGGQSARNRKIWTGERAVLAPIPAYFNAGVFCATRAAIPAFDLAIAKEPIMFRQRPRPIREQDLFNWAVWKTFADCSPDDAGWINAGERWNTMWRYRINKSIEPVILHIAAMPQSEKKTILESLFSRKV